MDHLPLGLVLEAKFVALERVSQAGLERQSFQGVRIQRFRIELKLVLAVLFEDVYKRQLVNSKAHSLWPYPALT